MPFDQSFIDEVRERVDLVKVIEPYVKLRRTGANWIGLCPFHQEKTPSFSVNPAKGLFKCFGCGKGGNVFTFLSEIEGLTFPDAVEKAAEIAGIPLPQKISAIAAEKQKEAIQQKKLLAEEIISLNRQAMIFWENCLDKDSPDAARARDYLNKRGLNKETIAKFHIGFAPNEWDSLLNFLISNGADAKLVAESGLTGSNEEKTKIYDRFRGRIIFPILDVHGKPVAFGARAIGNDEPKYLNSPETPAYIKGKHLFGLHQSAQSIRKRGFAILVEGYLDLLALFQAGIENVVASLGTALTPDQASLISRYTRQVLVNYDGDDAGLSAAKKAIRELISKNLNVKVLVLPDGKDPDDYIRQFGAANYSQLRRNAPGFLDFLLESSLSGRSINDPRQKAEAIEEVLHTISAIPNNVQKRESFDQSMAFFRIDDQGLQRELWQQLKKNDEHGIDSTLPAIKKIAAMKVTIAEQRLLELLFNDRELRHHILPALEPTDFEALASSAIFEAMLKIEDNGRDELDITEMLNLTEGDAVAEDLIPLLAISTHRRAAGEPIESFISEAESCVLTLRLKAIDNRCHEISREILIAERNGNTALVEELVGEKLDLERLKRVILQKSLHL